MAGFSVLTWNVNSVRLRLDNVLTYLEDHTPDVVCLQETKVEDKLFPRVPFMELGYEVHTHGSKGYAGVATMTRRPAEEVQRGFVDHKDKHCRILACTVQGTRIYNLYVPNGTALDSDAFPYKLDWLAKLRQELDDHFAGQSVVLVGDFNIAPDDRDVWDTKAMQGGTHTSPDERGALKHLLDFGLTDCYRKFESEGGHFTWFDYRGNAWPKRHGLRIDHVYATSDLAERCQSVVQDLEPRDWDTPSDHVPVVACFR